MNVIMTHAEKFVIPGMVICSAQENYHSGSGTYSAHGYIYASLAGKLKLVKQSEDAVKVEVHAPGEETVVPAVGDIVTCKVLAVNPRFAKMHIICVRDQVLFDPYFRGQLRKEDIRSFEKDKVEVYKSYRPGDIVLAKVLSLGEASSGFLLTTAENELGVVIAKSEAAGEKMVPISWTEMQCPKTYIKELRKVAKVIPENLAAYSENV